MDRDMRPVVALDQDHLEQVGGAVGSDDQEACRPIVIGDVLLGELVVEGVADVRIADAVLAGGAMDAHEQTVLQKVPRVSRAASNACRQRCLMHRVLGSAL
ncbi:MAG: hypothetical protein IT200_16360 [Thermoleophilia bacterium]|nr:hypothetical protein [Thermoleophilia bacterium]